jgi:DNA polymerase V
MYALVDCNNFYASCERVFQPKLNGKPIVILSNNDGCIISRSDEAKALGIPMGAPEFKVRQELKEKGIYVFSSNYPLYGDLSHRVMEILKGFTPHIEVYSIDEAFMNFDGIEVNFHDYGIQIKSRIQKWLSIPVCVGFAETKALSKVANKIARKFPEQTKGVHVIDTEEKRIKALKWTKIGDVWGIGSRLKKKMLAKDISTAYDFTLPKHEAYIKLLMGVVGIRLKMELEGKSVLELDDPTDDKNSIAITRMFKTKLTDINEIKERVSTFASICAEKLRKQKSCCHGIIVILIKEEQNESRNRIYSSQMETLSFASNSDLTISNTAVKILKKMYEFGERYSKAGVIVTGIIPENQKQFNLFEDENPKHLKLMQVMDAYHKKIGERKIRLGNQDLQHTWKMKQDHLSNKYTTDFSQILEIPC